MDYFNVRFLNTSTFFCSHQTHFMSLNFFLSLSVFSGRYLKLFFPKILIQNSGCCSLTWCLPPWPGCDAENAAMSPSFEIFFTKMPEYLFGICSPVSKLITRSYFLLAFSSFVRSCSSINDLSIKASFAAFLLAS